ncbi:MAG: hypothetical protein A2Y10_10305 [Planctomycetes bacterium GWF2_41_51]|nr:MAG: hypothetical protein A2Y10_10305 [Planctomycetes bacterium GWF2_41_51]HBG27667.1 hypothetical protein [Phycisphaerales bacterium]
MKMGTTKLFGSVMRPVFLIASSFSINLTAAIGFFKNMTTSPMFLVNYGKGEILVGELKLSSCNIDTVAGKILTNIINWVGIVIVHNSYLK